MSKNSWKIDRISMGTFALDGGAMFGIIPKPLWEKGIPADGKNRIQMQTNCMLLRGNNRNVIVETGNGWGFDPKLQEFYDMQRQIDWDAALQPFGLKPSSITDVIVTHLHFDHACGLSRKLSDGSFVYSFPKATHYVQKRQLEWAKNPTERDRGSYRDEGTQPFFSGAVPSKIVDGDVEILPGIRAQVIGGHTPGQQMIHVDAESGHYVFVADLLPTHVHLHLPYIMGYDLFPLDSLKEKKAFLEAAVAKGWILWFYHDPSLVAARVQYDGKRYSRGDIVLA